MVAIGTTMYFRIYDEVHAFEVRQPDGMGARTAMIWDLRPGSPGGGSILNMEGRVL